SSACTINSASSRVNSGNASRRCSSVTYSNSSTPDGTRKHLNPTTPASNIGASSAVFPGTTPPQNPTSTKHSRRASSNFVLKPASVVVGGIELSGISTSVVTPPAAAASVALRKPSHSVRPGALMCTCVSTSPGITTESLPASIISQPSTTSS